MVILPHMHLIDRDKTVDPKYRVTLALSDWTPEDTAWMCNTEMPNGFVSRSSIDLNILSRNYDTYGEALDFMSKLMDFCKFIKDNNVKSFQLVREHADYRFSHI